MYIMLKNYLKVAFRSLRKNKAHAFINICGLSIGMAASMLIGLWIWDELEFDTYHHHYHQIAQVMEKDTHRGTVNTGLAIPLPLEAEMRQDFGSDFKYIVMTSWTEAHIL